MIAAGRSLTPLEWGVVAPSFVPEGTAVFPYDVSAMGGYGEQPYFDEFGVSSGSDGAPTGQPVHDDQVIIIPMVGTGTAEGDLPPPVSQQEPPVVSRNLLRRFFGGVAEVARALWDSTDVFDPLTGALIQPATKDLYVVDRGIEKASSYTQRTFGQTIDAWVVEEILAARSVGQMTFRIAVLGPGDGNAERELFAKIAPIVQGLGMHLEVVTMTLPEHPMTPENRVAIQVFESAGIYLSPQFGDFDAGPLPFEEVDIVYAIMSTVYSRDPVALTAKIHDSLRRPTADRPGGQAFFMYRYGHVGPPTMMSAHALDLLDEGLDIVVVRPPEQLSAYAHMTRVSPEPLGDFGGLLVAVGKRSPFIGYRPTRGAAPMPATTNTEVEAAFDIFSRGSELLFMANGLDPGVLSQEAHLRSFDLLRPGIQAGLPIYPDAVAVAYGSRAMLYAIRGHGDEFAKHLPPTPTPSQRDLVQPQGARVRINF